MTNGVLSIAKDNIEITRRVILRIAVNMMDDFTRQAGDPSPADPGFLRWLTFSVLLTLADTPGGFAPGPAVVGVMDKAGADPIQCLTVLMALADSGFTATCQNDHLHLTPAGRGLRGRNPAGATDSGRSQHELGNPLSQGAPETRPGPLPSRPLLVSGVRGKRSQGHLTVTLYRRNTMRAGVTG